MLSPPLGPVTMTVWVCVAGLPAASVYVQWTVYVPGSEYSRWSLVEPSILPPQLSVAVGGSLTTFVPIGLPNWSRMMTVVGTPAEAEHSPVLVGNVARSGTGAVTSCTVTLKLVVAPSGLLVHVTT